LLKFAAEASPKLRPVQLNSDFTGKMRGNWPGGSVSYE